ncbi:TPA: hypothetical protein N0F65_012377 [Lagenidium giganteum]|uniref:Ketoreductase domain-containing protein n=1 Tax=Lagenidium giganteum TaxID=4803 RepID=A0AAV2YMC7_9STRA|nr:TPA: hypothetical protein N0F65_012377 [Lagenidium giganteum]
MAEEGAQGDGRHGHMRTVLVTGGTSGIGLECCRTLARQERTRVVVVGRSAERLEQALSTIREHAAPDSDVEGEVADLAELASVRSLVNRLIERQERLFAVVCNAGVESPPQERTVEGFETTFATNHLSHFLLVTALLRANQFEEGRKARVVVVSSGLHDATGKKTASAPDVSSWNRVAFGGPGWGGKQAYATSKLCNILFGYELERRFADQVEVFMYSPGLVPDTGLFRNHSAVGWWIVKSLLKVAAAWFVDIPMSTPERSGEFLARLGTDCALPWDSGSYFHIDHLFHTSDQSHDEQLARELWDCSLEWIDTEPLPQEP